MEKKKETPDFDLLIVFIGATGDDEYCCAGDYATPDTVSPSQRRSFSSRRCFS